MTIVITLSDLIVINLLVTSAFYCIIKTVLIEIKKKNRKRKRVNKEDKDNES